MGSTKSRRILAHILAVIIAVAIGVSVFSTAITLILTYEPYSQKLVITDDLAAECGAQLDAGLQTLAAESGIPVRVFDPVKEDYPIADSLVVAYQAQYSEENSTLYNKLYVDYFNKLLTEYAKGSELSFNKKHLHNTAEKAARIFSNTLGMHNTDSVNARVLQMKTFWNRVTLTGVVAVFLCALLLFYLYPSKTKVYSYFTSGIAAGAFAAALASLFLLITKAPSKITMTPEIYTASFQHLMKTETTVTLLLGLVLFALFYGLLFLAERRIYKKNMSEH